MVKSFRTRFAVSMAPLGLFLLAVPSPEPSLGITENLIAISINAGAAEVSATVRESTATVGGALSELGIETQNVFVAPDPTTTLQPNMRITVSYPKKLTLKDGVQTPRELFAFAATLEGAFIENGIALGALDTVSPSLTTPLAPDMTVTITRITETEREETVPVAFTTGMRENPELSYGRERTLQEGKKGIAREFVRVREKNGKVIVRNVLERQVLEEPIPKIVERGTKIVIGRVVEGGSSWYRYRGCLCAASTMFPKGTYLRVTNLENGKQVIVKVNDYGPTLPGRVIDLDAVAFKPLQPLSKGLFSARVEEIL